MPEDVSHDHTLSFCSLAKRIIQFGPTIAFFKFFVQVISIGPCPNTRLVKVSWRLIERVRFEYVNGALILCT
jgi:hypothetical protein